jgi:hypothetical protein
VRLGVIIGIDAQHHPVILKRGFAASIDTVVEGGLRHSITIGILLGEVQFISLLGLRTPKETPIDNEAAVNTLCNFPIA